MEPITVAQVVHSLEVGGMERVATHLAMHLSPRFRSLVVCLTCAGHFAPALAAAGVEVLALGKKPGKDLHLPRRLARIFRERRVRVVHAHNSGPMFTGGVAAKLAGARRFIVTDHCRCYPERPTVVATEWLLARLADDLVSVSEENRRCLIENLHWPARKIRVIPNGVAAIPEISPDERARLRAEFGLRNGEAVALTVARLEKQKNIANLVEVARRLRERCAACKMVVAGEGSERPALERRIAAHGLGDNVLLAGWRLDAPALYRIADLTILPSDWEGLPMSVLEAMSAGLPVVATDVGDVHTAVAHGRSGLLVPAKAPGRLADAVAELLGDVDKRRAFGAAGQAIWRERYSVEHMVARYEELYARGA